MSLCRIMILCVKLLICSWEIVATVSVRVKVGVCVCVLFHSRCAFCNKLAVQIYQIIKHWAQKLHSHRAVARTLFYVVFSLAFVIALFKFAKLCEQWGNISSCTWCPRFESKRAENPVHCFVECRNVIPSMIAFKMGTYTFSTGCLHNPCTTSRPGETIRRNILLMCNLFNLDRLYKALPVSEKMRCSLFGAFFFFFLIKSVCCIIGHRFGARQLYLS